VPVGVLKVQTAAVVGPDIVFDEEAFSLDASFDALLPLPPFVSSSYRSRLAALSASSLSSAVSPTHLYDEHLQPTGACTEIFAVQAVTLVFVIVLKPPSGPNVFVLQLGITVLVLFLVTSSDVNKDRTMARP